MVYPDDFYYTEEHDAFAFSENPPGELVVGELLQAKPCWRQPKEQHGRKPKTLIIADWTASIWTNERITSVNALLHQFLDDKFSVYAWSNDKLTALSLNGFDSLYLRNNMTPASYQDIVSFAASQHQWRKDTICVLDDYALERLIVPESTQKIRSIKTRDVLDSIHPTDDIETFILQAVPPIGEIYVDPEGHDLKKFIQNVAKKCSAITQKTSITVMQIPDTAEEAESLEQELNSSDDLLSLIKKNHFIEPNDVVLSLSQRSTFLKPLLPRIRRIEYSGSSLAELNLNDGSLDNLASLSITDLYDDDNAQLNLFLRGLTKAPNLRKISLSGGFIRSSAVEIASHSLESLSFKHCRISQDDLFTLLRRQSSSLRQLNLLNVQFEGVTEMHRNDLVFEHLELLSCSSLDATSLHNAETIFIRILKQSPHIKELSLHGIILTSFLNGSDITFHQLERLSVTINQSPESIQQLSIIIEKAPHLRRLKLDFHEMPSDPQHMATLDLARIESLEVDAGRCDPMPMSLFLFKKCHHLRDISVINHRALEPLDVTSMITDLDAPHLRKLNLIGCGMTLTSLSNLMTKSLYLRIISPIYAILANSITLHPSEQAQQARLKTMLMEADDCSLHEPYLSQYKKALQSALGIPMRSEDRPHDSSTHRMHNPKRPFQFRGLNQTNNQTMIIDKISQYMTLMRVHTSLIPRIQEGICNALSHLYLNEEPAVFASKVDMIREWDGHTSPHDRLRLIFEHIVTMIKRYQLSSSSGMCYYLGDSLDAFLNVLNEPCVLGNPWHAICIKPHDESSWWVYDPNYQNGAKKVPFNALKITIHKAIGSLVACKKHTSIQASIDNSGLFIQEGGLLALNRFHNLSMQLIPEGYTYTLEHLAGLLLHDMKGVPAWVIGIKNGKTAAYTATLLNNFIEREQTALQQLKMSIKRMNAFERYILMSALLKNSGEHDHTGFTETITRMGAQLVINSSLLIMDAGINAAYHTVDACLMTPLAQMLSYAQSLTPWREIVLAPPLPHPQRNALTLRENNAVYAESPEAYCLQTIRSPVLKKLIDLSSMEAIQAFSLLLLKTCLSTSRPVFYVDTADDLRCQSPYVKYQTDDVGILSAGPGGRLFDFIQSALSNPDSSPLLIVNYAHFKPSEMARFNALLDDARSADGIPLPEKMQIIGLINTSDPNCYEGADFYSRMHQHERCPFDTERLMSALKPLPFIAAHDDMPAHIIHLFHGADWRERLLGRWIIQGDQLFFKQGELKAAIESNQPLIIQNGNWANLDFQRFWHEAFLRKEIAYSGGVLKLPEEGLQLMMREGYDWSTLRRRAYWSSGFSIPMMGTPVLNPSRLGCFFYTYQCDNETQTLKTCPGLLEKNQGKTLNINVTRLLSEDEWASLLIECQKYNVTLSCYLGSNLVMPYDWAIEEQEEYKDSIHSRMQQHTQLIESTDPDTTIAQLLIDKVGDWNVIDVTECNASDLLIKIKSKFNTQRVAFEFTETKGLLATLDVHQNIILTGYFSNAFSDELAELLLTRSESTPSGGLILVSQNMENFQYLHIKKQIVSSEDKVRLLIERKYSKIEIATLTPEQLIEESLSRLEARLIYHRLNPTDPTDNAWQGIHHTPADIDQVHMPFDINTSESVSAAFNQHRLDALNAQLAVSPYVLITGLTGVGKSTFVERYLSPNTPLFHGAGQIQQWAQARTDAPYPMILFIDEANISSRQWSEFEGLFNNPPSIFVEGVYYPLSPQHKVIFAGNPINYGDRHLASFFLRHGNALLFQPMPFAYIYEEILKPILTQPVLQPYATLVATALLEVYEFLCHISQDDVLISPREIQMMALMVWSYTQALPHLDALQVQNAAHHYRYHLAKALVPESHQLTFEEKFLPKSPLSRLPRQNRAPDSHYVMTPSRNDVACQLYDVLQLSQARRNMHDTAPDALRYGGLGGLVLQGSSGIGKSELVMQTLVAAGYQKRMHGVANAPVSLRDHVFYHMPASMQQDVKTQLLNQAFHEGALVVMDEINASPMMENLLNDLLMGKTLEKNRPQQPGFFVIGTQNPPTMQGRRRPSPALARRLLTVTLPDYTRDEMKTILIHQGVQDEASEAWLCAYDKAYENAIRQNLVSLPTCRDLLNAVAADKAIMDLPPLDFSSIRDLLSKFELKVMKLEKERETNPKYKHIAEEARILHSKLLAASDRFLSSYHLDPSASQIFKQACNEAIQMAEHTGEFEKHRGFVQTTPLLREIAMCIRTLGNVLSLITLPVVKCAKHYLFGDDTPVFKDGIAATFFCPPKTDSFEKLQELKEGLEVLRLH